ncbi:MAG: type II secretion system protein GspK [Thiocapsa sp.]|jgi:general secretion pathway protein K|nr:type II secretion system protein GspK [Thiocapsa sp.]MCG6898294.1 type II secretion system protein GspK [Thiocapsa sp.]MCG6985088.1 type II secretion system protein GspK [Thiocapsa sp.]
MRHNGIALVLVLWVLTLLTVMALGLTAAQRTETALSDNHVSAARFRALADAALAYTVLVFAMPPPEATDPEAAAWLPNGVPRPWRIAGSDLQIRVTNETSRIDLNQATPELLAALLVALGAEDAVAESVAAAIVDWRDEDDLTLLNGAEDRDYRDAGRTIGAKDAPFVIAEELLQVIGMTPELYERLAPEVSVDIDDANFEERFASAAAVAALEGIPLDEAQARVAERDAPLFEDSGGPRFVDRGGPLYRIEVGEVGRGRLGRRMEALIETTPGEQPPYRVRWRRFGLTNAPPPSSELRSD